MRCSADLSRDPDRQFRGAEPSHQLFRNQFDDFPSCCIAEAAGLIQQVLILIHACILANRIVSLSIRATSLWVLPPILDEHGARTGYFITGRVAVNSPVHEY